VYRQSGHGGEGRAQDGVEFFAERRLATVFSASNYCGNFNNHAAMCVMEEDLKARQGGYSVEVQCRFEAVALDPKAPVAKKRKTGGDVTIGDIELDEEDGEEEPPKRRRLPKKEDTKKPA